MEVRSESEPAPSPHSVSFLAVLQCVLGAGLYAPQLRAWQSTNVQELRWSNVGNWGSTCTCPDGEVYWVGDHNNGCATVAWLSKRWRISS